MNINMGVGYIGEPSGLQQFVCDRWEKIQELDAHYIICWPRWMQDIVNGMPVGVQKVKCEESDGDVHAIGGDTDDCLEPVNRTTPAKRKSKSQLQDARDDSDDRSSSNSGG